MKLQRLTHNSPKQLGSRPMFLVMCSVFVAIENDAGNKRRKHFST